MASAAGTGRWLDLAREVGSKIGRLEDPVAFLLGAGASFSSGGPTTTAVVEAFRRAAGARLDGTDLMNSISQLDEREKQAILSPLFRSVTPGAGYHALASLAAYRKVFVLNLNWDEAMADAGRAKGLLRGSFDLADDPASWPSLGDQSEPGLYDIHLHGRLGEECRFARLETLRFSDEERGLLMQCLDGLMVSIGASLAGELDLPAVFKAHQAQRDSTKANDHWYFLRGEDSEDGTDRYRKAVTYASPWTTAKDPALDFDRVAVTIVDAAIAVATEARSVGGP